MLASTYVDRLIGLGQSVTPDNVHLMALCCVATASKFLDDAFVSNKRYAEIGGVSTSAYNILEIELLKQLNFGLGCPAGLFRKSAVDVLEGREASPMGITSISTSVGFTHEGRSPTVAPKPAASSNRVYAGRQATDYSALVERAARAERAWGTKSARSQGASSGVRAAQSEAMAIRAAEEAPHRDMDTRGRSNSYGHTPPGETLHVVC